jgi:short-subunit dehydrogenase
MRREQKSVLITGAGSGIGRALAVEAAKRGMDVAVFGRRRDALEETLALLGSPNGHLAVSGDITRAADRRLLIDRLASEWGSLDLLINNAGIMEGGPLGGFDDDALAHLFNTNVIGPMALTRDLMPLLSKARPSRVVNIGSIFGDIPYPLFAAYSASKFALRGFSIALRREWKEKGIGVTYAAPRATRTAILAHVEHLMSKVRADTPERVAAQIWQGIANGATSVYAPGPERLFVFLQRVFPRAIDRALSTRPTRSRAA